MTDIESAKILGAIIAAYPRQEVPEQTSKVYAKFLQDLDYKMAQAAIIRIIANNKFFPAISEIREAVLHVDQPNLLLAADAWEEVTRQMRDIGYVRTPIWSHPLIGKAVQAMGGWISLCQSEDGMVDRAHFLKVFESYRNRYTEQERTSPIMQQLIGGMMNSLPAWPGDGNK